MPAPTEIRDCHLPQSTQQQQQQQQPGGSTLQAPPATLNNKSGGEFQFSVEPAARKKNPNACRRRSTHHQPVPSSQPVYPSRSGQRTTSPTRMASSPSSVSLTRTGRISKAKKGLKVHHCEICRRSYTRAEHLRRHQKNHAVEDTLVCKFPNCDKSFHRVDLLQRHERHHESGKISPQVSMSSPGDSLDPSQPSQPDIQASHAIRVPSLPADPAFHTPQPMTPMHEPISLPRYRTSQFRTPQLPQLSRTIHAPTSNFNPVIRSSPSSMLLNQTKQQNAFVDQHLATIPMAVEGMVPGLWNDSYSQSPSYTSSDGYPSPVPGSNDYGTMFPHMPYCPEPDSTRASSTTSFVDPSWSHVSQSPVSPTSTTSYPWILTDKAPNTPCSATFMNTFYPTTTSMPMTSYESFHPTTLTQRDEQENVILFGEQPYGMDPFAHTYPFEQYLDCYWRFFHPTYPIVHRPTFRRLTASPMLHAAMIVIGGQFSRDTSVRRNSRMLHDRCLKLLERRAQDAMLGPERLQDGQANFLLEVMSHFRARRSAKMLSSRFVKTYQNAFWSCKDTTSSMVALRSRLSQGTDSTADRWGVWIERTGWERLLQACYIFESHQVLLLAREPASSHIQETGYELIFPMPLSLWDAETDSEWSCAIQQFPHWFQYVYEVVPELLTRPLDPFQSSMVLAAHYNHFDDYRPYVSMPPAFHLSDHLDSSPAVLRFHLTAKLIHVTPLRALLAVAGESWIFSDKVNVDAYAGLKTTLRAWMAQLWSPGEQTHGQISPVGQALAVAIEILTAAIEEEESGDTVELGTDLGVYFAALVVWAVWVAVTCRYDEGLSTVPAFAGIASGSTAQPSYTKAERTAVVLSFLASFIHSSMNAITTGNVSSMARRHMDCTALLLWAKSRLYGELAEDEGTGNSHDGEEARLGELLDSMRMTIGRIVDKGCKSWGEWYVP